MSINFDHTTGNISIAAPASATGKVLSDDGTWISVNPMTASGDMVYGGASGIPTRLAKGTDTQVLTLASGVPTWADASGSDISLMEHCISCKNYIYEERL